jgi:hypothetical protein
MNGDFDLHGVLPERDRVQARFDERSRGSELHTWRYGAQTAGNQSSLDFPGLLDQSCEDVSCNPDWHDRVYF